MKRTAILVTILSGALLVACGDVEGDTCEAVRAKLSGCVFSAEQVLVVQQMSCDDLVAEYDEQSADCSQAMGKADGIDWTEKFARWFHEKTGWCTFEVCVERQNGWCVESTYLDLCDGAWIVTGTEG